MKYHTPIGLHKNEAHQMVLQRIQKGSKVLEFGAASGRMTKLLSREYGCTVYIIECEKEAFELAMQYAFDGMCTDIEQYQWKKWAGGCFDYILFGDVLEHLKNPKRALQETKELLKDSGSVLISVPNICHNDILAKMYYNRFEYTDEGLLDDSHIYFFSERTLESFVAGTGYMITAKQYKTVSTGATEQYWDKPFYCSDSLYQLLRERENGEVYQFVLELKKEKSHLDRIQDCQKPLFMPLSGLVYFDRGTGFSQEDTAEVVGYRIPGGGCEYEFKDRLLLDADVKRVRIDPVEGQACQLVSVTCSLGAAEIPNKVLFEEKEFILDEDPQMIWEVPEEGRDMSYDIRIQLSMEGLVRDMLRYGLCAENEKAELKNKNKSLETEKSVLETEKSVLEKAGMLLENEKAVLESARVSLENEKELLEKKMLFMEQQNFIYASQLSLQEKELDKVYHSKSWRYTKVFRKIYALVMRL